MERTQTSLLVDIYQYLERNKKLGAEREELRRQNLLEAEQQAIAQRLASDENEDDVPNNEIESLCNSSGNSTDSDVIAGDEQTIENDVTGSSCDNDIREGVDLADNCGLENHVDGRSSRFIVSPVDEHNTDLPRETKLDSLKETNERFSNVIDEQPHETGLDGLSEADQLFNDAENIEGSYVNRGAVRGNYRHSLCYIEHTIF